MNSWIYCCARDAGIDVFPFFDMSHGAGVLPEKWPDFIGEYCGYAGNRGPRPPAGDKDIWIDNRFDFFKLFQLNQYWSVKYPSCLVRSDHDKKFDIKKVRKCLEIANRRM